MNTGMPVLVLLGLLALPPASAADEALPAGVAVSATALAWTESGTGGSVKPVETRDMPASGAGRIIRGGESGSARDVMQAEHEQWRLLKARVRKLRTRLAACRSAEKAAVFGDERVELRLRAVSLADELRRAVLEERALRRRVLHR